MRKLENEMVNYLILMWITKGIGWGPYLIVKIWVDITKPLLRRCMITITGKPTWIPFKYEKFPYFYFRYDLIKHASSRCSKGPNVNKIHDSEQYQ